MGNYKRFVIYFLVFNLCFFLDYLHPKFQNNKGFASEYNQVLTECYPFYRQIETNAQSFNNTVDKLRQKCADIRAYKSSLNFRLQRYKQFESALINQLNEHQLELYVELFDSLADINSAKIKLYNMKLRNSLDPEQNDLLSNLFMELGEISRLKIELNKRIRDFENRKAMLMKGLRLLFSDDSASYEILKFTLEQDLSY